MKSSLLSIAVFAIASMSYIAPTFAQRVFLNPSDQSGNPVSGGGSEADYALINGNLARDILVDAGFTVMVNPGVSAAAANANSWGADIFVSIHSNAGGGHGTETLYKSEGGKVLAQAVQRSLVDTLGYRDRSVVFRNDLAVLNNTNMFACLAETVFHDCVTVSGQVGHPPSESSFLRSSEGQKKIARGIAEGVCAYYGRTCYPATPKGQFVGVVYHFPDMEELLQGALVAIDGGASTVTTGADGMFVFDLDPGSFTATATLAGYLPGSVTRTVTSGQIVIGSIGLRESDATSDAGSGDSADSDTDDSGFDAESGFEADGGYDASVGSEAGAGVGDDASASRSRDGVDSDDSGCSCGVVGDRSCNCAFPIIVFWFLFLGFSWVRRVRIPVCAFECS